jgi:hypothetical protein
LESFNGIVGLGTAVHITDPRSFPRLLRLGGQAKGQEHGAERNKKEALADY